MISLHQTLTASSSDELSRIAAASWILVELSTTSPSEG